VNEDRRVSAVELVEERPDRGASGGDVGQLVVDRPREVGGVGGITEAES
jgi:hypothetical protein